MLNIIICLDLSAMFGKSMKIDKLYHVLSNANEFDIPRAQTSLAGRLPLCTLPSTWNYFEDPELIKNIDLRLDFKSMLKNHIIEKVLTICTRLLCPMCHLKL